MASPEYVIQLIIQGKDEASETLRTVYGEMKKGNETIEQARDRMLDYRSAIREQNRVQQTAMMAWRQQNQTILETVEVLNRVGTIGQTAMRMFTQYTMMSLRLERAMRDVADAQKELNTAQTDYLSALYKTGPYSEETRRAYEQMRQAQQRLADAEQMAANIASQNRMAMLGMGLQAVQIIPQIVALITQLQQLRIVMAMNQAQAGAGGAAMGLFGAGIMGVVPIIGTVVAAVGGFIGLLMAFSGSGEQATRKIHDCSMAMGYLDETTAKSIVGLDKISTGTLGAALAEKLWIEITNDEAKSREILNEQFDQNAVALQELTGLNKEEYQIELERGNYIPVLVEATRSMVKAGMDYNSIVARLIELHVDEKRASELATTALEEEARERVAATKAAGDSADEALASIADLKLPLIEAENIVREFYETWTSDAEVAAAAQLKLFQETAAQLPKFLQGFEMGERSIAGMAEEARLKFHQIADVISQVTGARVELVPSEWFAEAIKSMGIDVGNFREYSEEQLSQLYVMMQENPALTAYVWNRAIETMGTNTMPVILQMGSGVEQLTRQWNDAVQEVRDYGAEVERAGGLVPEFEPLYLERVRGVEVPSLAPPEGDIFLHAGEEVRKSFGATQIEQQITIGPVTLGPFTIAKEVDIEEVMRGILRRLADLIIYQPRGVA